MNTTTGHPQSLARGALGTALRLAVDTHTEPAAAPDLHDHVRGLGPVVNGPDAGLFYGAPALALVLHLAPAGYRLALERLDEVNEALTRRRLTAAFARMDRRAPAAFAEYDVIRGLSGLGLLWLHRDTRPALVKDVLTYLVLLTAPTTGDRPGWWVWHRPDDIQAPGGHANNALAHGVAGPLAVLALARRRGITVDGHDHALRRVLDHLDAARHDDDTGCWWDRWDRDARTTPPPLSWCYGAPGLVRAQQLAALALQDRNRQVMLEQVLLRQLEQIAPGPAANPCLCHGTGGLLRACERITEDATDPGLFRGHIQVLRTWLAASRSPATPGVLDGHAGVRLAIQGSTVPWDAFLALA